MPLHLGRTKRLASREQRLALIAALHGCSRPGCNAPASMCAVHHVLDYRKNGITDLTNLTLACDSCHALIHDGPGGWKTSTEGSQSHTQAAPPGSRHHTSIQIRFHESIIGTGRASYSRRH